jgi:hypothetical protein
MSNANETPTAAKDAKASAMVVKHGAWGAWTAANRNSSNSEGDRAAYWDGVANAIFAAHTNVIRTALATRRAR